jgi:hypothetical protein
MAFTGQQVPGAKTAHPCPDDRDSVHEISLFKSLPINTVLSMTPISETGRDQSVIFIYPDIPLDFGGVLIKVY